MTTDAAITTTVPNSLTTFIPTVLEVIAPFRPDDGAHGTYLIMRLAGLDSPTACSLIKRKYNTIRAWIQQSEDFRRVMSQLPELSQQYCNQARVIRASIMDSSIIEAGNKVFSDIIKGEHIKDGAWAFATKLAALRVPVMLQDKGASGWEKMSAELHKLMQAGQQTKQLTVATENVDGSRTIIEAKETTSIPSAEELLAQIGETEDVETNRQDNVS